jgi:7-cyano-7-deazaguanine tRNA-ribosyltransferase
MQKEFGVTGLITNAYIIKKHYESKAVETGIHSLLDFKGIIMTDSGAYQILVYGDVETTNKEIIRFQEQIDTDIATILDVPTGWGISQEYAKRTVEETWKRAKEFSKIKTRDDILWVGPVQGGIYLKWLAKSAEKMSKLPFQIHAIGSPTPVMEQYLFETLVDMIMTARINLPTERPVHLFGAGHPFMFSLAVALGCDLFDSAAYALFAREDRYMTETGTKRLSALEYFPCSCPVCNSVNPEDVKQQPKEKRQEFLARHNLHVSLTEIKRIKQAIKEGQLWEHVQMRAHSHPALLRSLKRLSKYAANLEVSSPISKDAGLFFYDSNDLIRPEVVRYSKRLSERYSPPKEAKFLLLLPHSEAKPFHKSREHGWILREMNRKIKARQSLFHVCTYEAPFGIVPMELDETYPLSQHEAAVPFDSETITHVAREAQDFIAARHYRKVILLQDKKTWRNTIASACRRACKKRNIPLVILDSVQPWNKLTMNKLMDELQRTVREKT